MRRDYNSQKVHIPMKKWHWPKIKGAVIKGLDLKLHDEPLIPKQQHSCHKDVDKRTNTTHQLWYQQASPPFLPQYQHLTQGAPGLVWKVHWYVASALRNSDKVRNCSSQEKNLSQQQINSFHSFMQKLFRIHLHKLLSCQWSRPECHCRIARGVAPNSQYSPHSHKQSHHIHDGKQEESLTSLRLISITWSYWQPASGTKYCWNSSASAAMSGIRKKRDLSNCNKYRGQEEDCNNWTQGLQDISPGTSSIDPILLHARSEVNSRQNWRKMLLPEFTFSPHFYPLQPSSSYQLAQSCPGISSSVRCKGRLRW